VLRGAAHAGLRVATAAARRMALLRTLAGGRHAPPPAEGPFRVLMIAQYPLRFAGTKYRLGTWAERLRRRGFEVDLVPAVPDAAAERLTNDWSVRARVEFHLRLLRGRLRAVGAAGRYHACVVHMNDLPFWDLGGPWVAEALRRRCGRLILDLDDLPVLGGAQALSPRARALGDVVDGLSLGNRVLPAHYPGRPWWFVPTCVEPSEWPVPDRSLRAGPPLLGWVGTPGNLANLRPLAGVLADACRRHGARVRIVCSEPAALPGVPEEFVKWTPEGEASDLVPVDVGLAPLVDGPMQRCKCGLKALQYQASGAAVVASPVGALTEIVEDGSTGLLASTPEEWGRALDRLLTDRDLRLRLGAAGRKSAEERWSFAAHEATFEDALRGVRQTGGHP
jgi:glycosyltransferase involved in cell wall biosynthesis